MAYTCACGAEATCAADVFRDGDLRPSRLLLCSPHCVTVRVPGTRLDVILEGREFAQVMGPGARPCWCPSVAHPCVSPVVPFCPEHGYLDH